MKLLLVTVFFSLLFTVSVFANTPAFIIDEATGRRIPIPMTYEFVGMIRNLGSVDNIMSHPEDIHIDQWNNIFIADTGNNRIIKADIEGNVLKEIAYADGMSLNRPRGIFVDEYDIIWIADTGNQRIVTIYPGGTDRQTFVRPDSPLLGDTFTFDPARIWVNDARQIFILRGTELFSIDENNNFRGFIGAREVGFSLTRTLIRTFGTQAQRDRTLRQIPDAYSSFVIGANGMIYGTLQNAYDDQIRRLNIQGRNTFPAGVYGEVSPGRRTAPNLSDIHVNDIGIVTVIDEITGRIFQYDQEGNLIMAFGALGSVQGTFSIPVAIDFDSNGYLYVLDFSSNMIQIFRPTLFLRSIHQAIYHFNEGRYAESTAYWETVLGIHANYALAHRGLANVFIREHEWELAMHSFLAAGDRVGYSRAFNHVRHQIFRDYFFFIVIGVFAGLYGFVKLFVFLKRKSDALAFYIIYGRRPGDDVIS